MYSQLLETNAEIEKINLEDCDINVNNVYEEHVEVFGSEDEMKQSLTHLCYGDLYIIGRIWIEAMKTTLLGRKLSLIPAVHAAAKPEPPQRPPPMKYTDLSMYRSPHYEYKDYIEDQKKCPKAKKKIMQDYLLPKVKCYRKDLQKASCDAKCALCKAYCNCSKFVDESKRDLKKMMRDPNNLTVRQGLVLAGGTAGFLLGSGKGVPRRLFFTGIGLLSTGALCFPKETDAAFRDFAYYTGKMAIAFYNGLCRKDLSLRERIPCKEDLPPPSLPVKTQCPPKKK